MENRVCRGPEKVGGGIIHFPSYLLNCSQNIAVLLTVEQPKNTYGRQEQISKPHFFLLLELAFNQ
jgi:hypothetical protein